MSLDLATLTLGPANASPISERDRNALSNELQLLSSLESAGLEVMSAGSAFPEADQIATTASQWREHANNAAEVRAPCVLLNLLPGVRADDVAACVRYLARELDGPARLIVYGRFTHPGPQTTTLLACHSRLQREGFSARIVLGPPNEPRIIEEIRRHASFDNARAAAHPAALITLSRLKRTRFLTLGPLLDPQAGIHPSLDALVRTLGPDVSPLSPGILEERIELLCGKLDLASPDPRIQGIEAEAPDEDRLPLARLLALGDLLRDYEADGLAAHGILEGPRWNLSWKHLPSERSPSGAAQSRLQLASRCDLDTLTMQRTLCELDAELPRVEADEAAPAPAIFCVIDGMTPTALRLRSPGPTPWEFATRSRAESSWTIAAWIRDEESYRAVAWELRLRESSDSTFWFEAKKETLPAFPSPHVALIPGAHAAALAELAAVARLSFEVLSLENGWQRG